MHFVGSTWYPLYHWVNPVCLLSHLNAHYSPLLFPNRTWLMTATLPHKFSVRYTIASSKATWMTSRNQSFAKRWRWVAFLSRVFIGLGILACLQMYGMRCDGDIVQLWYNCGYYWILYIIWYYAYLQLSRLYYASLSITCQDSWVLVSLPTTALQHKWPLFHMIVKYKMW